MIRWRSRPLARRLTIYITLLIAASIIATAIVSYVISKRALDTQGITILKNSAVMANAYVNEVYSDYTLGYTTYDEALEDIRSFVNGEKNSEGIRDLNTNIDLGEHGYFIIYTLDGIAIAHPNLEDQSLWDVTDPLDDTYFIVREQIESALYGDGTNRYNWRFADTENIDMKITYGIYNENFEWVIVATTYEVDFNQAARSIINYNIIFMIVFIILGAVVGGMFVMAITRPINKVLKAMTEAANGNFVHIVSRKRNDEVGNLVEGFNVMSTAIEDANENIKRQAQHISFLAYNDAISELPNRNRFSDYVNVQIKDGVQSGYVLQLDIKDFKIVNSALGSDLGDVILRHIGQSFLAVKDSKSMIARTSGNEFSIWFANIHHQELIKNINAFKRVLNERLERENITQNIEFHYAYAAYPEHGNDFDTLYKHASIAMKYAKENRDLKVYRFENTMLEVIENDLRMSKLLEYAIFNQEITVAYQAKVSLETGKVTGVEALARWYSSTLGYVGPDVFIPAINRSNLTVLFGQYMLEQIFFEDKFIQKKYGNDVKIAVNISPIFFLEKQFVNTLHYSTQKYDVQADRVVLEITEDIFISDLEVIKDTVAQLRAYGYQISLDDFGTGYSSLNYLKNIDICEVKIDKSFIDRITTDEKTLAMLEAIRRITKAYNYEVVAEGVETKEQVEILKAVGYDTVQGYYYSKPTPVDYE